MFHQIYTKPLVQGATRYGALKRSLTTSPRVTISCSARINGDDMSMRQAKKHIQCDFYKYVAIVHCNPEAVYNYP